ncbi:hypothetical protein MMC19_001266 [Ptychographa xylographoides]|nr:hypothetical protein [Ptychographa xylographoides]
MVPTKWTPKAKPPLRLLTLKPLTDRPDSRIALKPVREQAPLDVCVLVTTISVGPDSGVRKSAERSLGNEWWEKKREKGPTRSQTVVTR